MTEPAVQTDWENALPVQQLETHNYSVRWTGTLTAFRQPDIMCSAGDGRQLPLFAG